MLSPRKTSRLCGGRRGAGKDGTTMPTRLGWRVARDWSLLALMPKRNANLKRLHWLGSLGHLFLRFKRGRVVTRANEHAIAGIQANVRYCGETGPVAVIAERAKRCKWCPAYQNRSATVRVRQLHSSTATVVQRRSQISRHPWRTSPPPRPRLGFRYIQGRAIFLVAFCARASRSACVADNSRLYSSAMSRLMALIKVISAVPLFSVLRNERRNSSERGAANSVKLFVGRGSNGLSHSHQVL
jgi:hypothetical protein